MELVENELLKIGADHDSKSEEADILALAERKFNADTHEIQSSIFKTNPVLNMPVMTSSAYYLEHCRRFEDMFSVIDAIRLFQKISRKQATAAWGYIKDDFKDVINHKFPKTRRSTPIVTFSQMLMIAAKLSGKAAANLMRQQAELCARAVGGDLDLQEALPHQRKRVAPEVRESCMRGLKRSGPLMKKMKYSSQEEITDKQGPFATNQAQSDCFKEVRETLSTIQVKTGSAHHDALIKRQFALADAMFDYATRTLVHASQLQPIATKAAILPKFASSSSSCMDIHPAVEEEQKMVDIRPSIVPKAVQEKIIVISTMAKSMGVKIDGLHRDIGIRLVDLWRKKNNFRSGEVPPKRMANVGGMQKLVNKYTTKDTNIMKQAITSSLC